MTPKAAGATALAAVLTLGACGTTYVDESVAARDTLVPTTTTTLPPVDPDTPLPELLTEIEERMATLSETIIEDDLAAIDAYERIDELWIVAEQKIRNDDPDDLYNFQQAITLAETGAERRRPADASKGYKLIVDVIDSYLDG